MSDDVEDAYAHRATDYTARLGSMASVHPSDEHLVTTWAATVDGPILDAGCGPGHWTAHLAQLGFDVHGVDQVQAFITAAKAAYPGATFSRASIDALTDPADTYGGVLAWYSLIHHEPSELRHALGELTRVLRPGGRLLVGFFLGNTVEPFDHAVVTAYRWPTAALADELSAAGFDVLETHTRSGAAEKARPHGAILAQLTPEATPPTDPPG